MGKYVILKCRPVEFDTRADDNHIFIHALTQPDSQDYSLAVNVQSCVSISRLYYRIKEFDMNDPELPKPQRKWLSYWLDQKSSLYTFADEPDGMRFGVHYHNGWVDRENMLPAEDEETFRTRSDYDRIDPDKNDLAAALIREIRSSITDKKSYIIATGTIWGPKEERDWTFGFYPTQGLHDIHENDTAPDGALFFYYPDLQRVVGIFTRFVRV